MLLCLENESLIQELKDESQLAERANADKSRFLASASHDLRQPLQAMNLFAETLKQHIKDTEQQELLHNLRSSLKAVGSLLDSLLDMSKLEAGLVHVHQKKFLLYPMIYDLEKEFRSQASMKPVGLSMSAHIKKDDGSLSPVSASDIIVTSDPILLKNMGLS